MAYLLAWVGHDEGVRLYAPAFVPAPQFTLASGRIFYDQALDRLRALPGVRNASLTSRLPMYAAGASLA